MEGRQGSAGLQRPVPRTLPYLQQEGSQLSLLNRKTTHQNAVCACRNMLRSNTFLWYVTHCDCDMSHIVTVIWGQWCKVPTSKANAQRGGGGGGKGRGSSPVLLGSFQLHHGLFQLHHGLFQLHHGLFQLHHGLFQLHHGLFQLHHGLFQLHHGLFQLHHGLL